MDLENGRQSLVDIGESISRRVGELYTSRREAALEFASATGLRTSTAYEYLRLYCRGQFHLGFSPDVGNRKRRKCDHQLEKISILYELLGYTPEDPIVIQTKGLNPDFVFPPADVPYQEPAVDLDVHFHDDHLSLSPHKLLYLQHLAIQLATTGTTISASSSESR